MLLSAFLKDAASALTPLYGASEARSIVALLVDEMLGMTSYTHIVSPECEVPGEKLGELASAMERLLANEPVQYVLGKAWFYGYRFNVSPSVLIPRPETEILVQEAVSFVNGRQGVSRVLDVCTGSGCIAWSVALSCPGTEVTALDISSDALSIASAQVPQEPLPSGIVVPRFRQCDALLPPPEEYAQAFDVLLSNPPYIMEREKSEMRRNVLDFEPGLALFVPDRDPLLFYRSLAKWAGAVLKSGGAGIVEINEKLGEDTLSLFETEGLSGAHIVKDLYGKDRFVVFVKD